MNDMITFVISLFSIFISLSALWVSMWSLKEQKEYNRLCEMPIPYIFFMNYENEIGMEIKNYGKGVLFLEKIIFKDNEGNESRTLYDLMPNDIKWKNYLIVPEEYHLAISPNEKLVFICLSSDDEDEKNKARNALNKIHIDVIYKDVYGRKDHYKMSFKGQYMQ